VTDDEPIILDMREKLAHIDQMLADHDRKRQEIRMERQEIRMAPWALALTGVASGAALFAAAFAFAKLF
jgi:hypothetical protein